MYTSWLSQPGAPQLIFEWVNKYVQKGYQLTGITDVVNMEQTVYKWGNDALSYKPQGKEYIMIFRKKS